LVTHHSEYKARFKPGFFFACLYGTEATDTVFMHPLYPSLRKLATP